MAPVASLEHDSLVSVSSDIIDTYDNAAIATNPDSSSPPSASSSKQASDPVKLRPRVFVWGEKVVRSALPCHSIPPWLDPLSVDIEDPRKLPLCWYGVPFYSGMIFAYAQRVRVAVYMEEDNLNVKAGDLDVFGTWPKLVKWFEDQSGFTMHLHQVWDSREPLLTFFNNHEIPRVTKEMWEFIIDLLDDIGYPEGCDAMWYLDRRQSF